MRTTILIFILSASLVVSASASEPDARSTVAPHIESGSEIQTAIVKGIVANPTVFAADLRVDVADRQVTLRGSVRDEEAKVTAENIARAVPGVRKVKNLLTVRPVHPK